MSPLNEWQNEESMAVFGFCILFYTISTYFQFSVLLVLPDNVIFIYFAQ